MSRKNWCPSLLVGFFTISAGLWASSCNLQVEIYAQIGAFTCDRDSQCPDSMFCDNYFNAYVYYMDMRGQPIAEGKWGYCANPDNLIMKDNLTSAEVCSNDQDEDGDGKVDCLDPECQTAPQCRAWLQAECADGEPPEICEARLGFPLVRSGEELSDDTCPPAVGYQYVTPDGEAFCLPRCRLYFPTDSPGTNNTDADFSGSDDYCEQVTASLATHASFADLRCQHTGVSQTQVHSTFQNDVCLPQAPDRVVDTPTTGTLTETCLNVCGAARCLQISYKQRNWTYFSAFEEARMIAGNDPEQYTQTAFYCLD